MPPEGLKILLTLFLCFLIGLEREEHRGAGPRYSFGGVRTFPLIGLIGYALALLSGNQLIPVTFGFGVIGAFLWLSYKHKLETYDEAGVTTEVSGLIAYVIGALVSRDQIWIATTIAVISMLLLELKEYLGEPDVENTGHRDSHLHKIPSAYFLSSLPVVPNREFGPFAINPF